MRFFKNLILDVFKERMDKVIGCIETDLDGRFAMIRTQETNLGDNQILFISYSQIYVISYSSPSNTKGILGFHETSVRPVCYFATQKHSSCKSCQNEPTNEITSLQNVKTELSIRFPEFPNLPQNLKILELKSVVVFNRCLTLMIM